MEILTPTEACLESSSDLTISTTEDIDIVRHRTCTCVCSPTNPIGSSCEMCAIDVRSPRKYHVDNTRRKVCDGASCAFIGLFGCVGHQARHLDGTSTCAAGRRQTPERSVRPIMQTSIASEYPRVRRRVLDRVMSLDR